MRHQYSRLHLCFVVGVLVGSLALLGCPKRPEVAQAGPGAVGPAAARAPYPMPAPPAPRTSPETPVTRATPPAATPMPAPSAPMPAAPMPAPPPPAMAPAAAPLHDVFFDFDKSAIREDQESALGADVAWLKANPGAKLTVEGHCDERGTVEYNLGLGERRAKAVKDYLVAAGIGADRVATVSYGKERPFVLGHDESAWKWNRRGHFVITSK
jgi:peptidoglycan-associated lipoprotein